MSRGLVLRCIWSFVLCAPCVLPAAAVALPNSRGYELVSPLYKGGYGVATIAAASPSGNSLAFSSLGSFAGSPGGPSLQNGYLAGRHTSGWVTSPLEVPAAITPEAWGSELSPTLESEVVLTKPGPNAGAALRVGTEMRFWRHQTNSPDSGDGWEAAGPALEAVNGEPFSSIEGGANATLTHVLVGLATAPLLTQAENTERQLYDVVVGRGEAPALRLVGVDNEGKAIDAYCPVKPIPSAEQGSMFNDISADGSEIFFATNVEPAQQINCVGNPGNPVQVFARLGGARTIEISRPLGPCARNGVPGEVPCDGAASRAPAIFQGAREDGSTVFFTTTAALTGGTDESTNLYVARIGCPPAEEGCDASKREVTALTKLSQVGNPVEGADVQGVVRVAPDGSRAYFVARGVLSAAPNAEGRVALKGADNLYVVDSGSGNITFVSELCSGSAVSGVVSTMACPVELTAGALGRNDSTLWLGNGEGHASEAQTAGASGAYFLFSSFGQLTADDTDTARDIYRYDAETGVLARVSDGEGGYDANGNEGAADSEISSGKQGGSVVNQYDLRSRAITEDGSRVVFWTADPLSPNAVNGLTNVYEWHAQSGSDGGAVSLVSSGASPVPDEEAVISSSGDDIFFRTAQGLAPQDTDGADDVYDARIGGGFPATPAPLQPCSGDACQGPLTNPAPLLVPGSVSQAPGENLEPPLKPAVKAKQVKPKKRPAAVTRRKRRDKSSRRASGVSNRRAAGGGR